MKLVHVRIKQKARQWAFMMIPKVEPTDLWLTAECSATELLRKNLYQYHFRWGDYIMHYRKAHFTINPYCSPHSLRLQVPQKVL